MSHGAVILNKEKFIQSLVEIGVLQDLISLKSKIILLKDIITNHRNDKEGFLNIDVNGDTASLRQDVLTSKLIQILESQTLERAKYYLKRLENGIQKIKTNKINDINLLRWKEYDEIITDSLWMLDKRDTSGAHLGCIPLIHLRALALNLGVSNVDSAMEIIKQILEKTPDEKVIDKFIKLKYEERIQAIKTIPKTTTQGLFLFSTT